jgi:hypothetical protein
MSTRMLDRYWLQLLALAVHQHAARSVVGFAGIPAAFRTQICQNSSS